MLIYDKPVIYYPLSNFMLAGISQIFIIITPEDQPSFCAYWAEGAQIGCCFCYEIQEVPNE